MDLILDLDPVPATVTVPFDAPVSDAPGMSLQKAAVARLEGGAPPFRMSRFTLEPGASSPLDTHPDREVWMVASGQGRLACGDGRTQWLRAGDALNFPSHLSHSVTNTGGEPLSIFSVWWGGEP